MNDTMPPDFAATARRVIAIETDATTALSARIGDSFSRACEIILACRGRVIVTGMGKSGHVGTKIAATLASTGTPAFFVHPAEARHGDLGMITGEDVLIAISNSGNTEEVTAILPVIKRKGTPLIAMTGDPHSTLGSQANIVLDVSVEREACPLNLAPTASTTVTLVMGDALAVALLEARGFTANDFALSHPGGSLGRKLLLMVEDVMQKGDRIPRVPPTHTVSQALLEISSKGLGMTSVVDGEGLLMGVFTDGDLRRTLDSGIDIRATLIGDVMSRQCKVTHPNMLAAEALAIMEGAKINGLMVVDEARRPVGALNMHDLLRAGVM